MIALTPAHLTALAKLVAGLPFGDLAALLAGTATADTVLDLAEQATGLIAAAFPPGALVAGEVGFAIEALQFLLDAAGVGADPMTIEPGYNPIRGGWEGARGHV